MCGTSVTGFEKYYGQVWTFILSAAMPIESPPAFANVPAVLAPQGISNAIDSEYVENIKVDHSE